MSSVYSFLFIVHVMFGSMALILFWLPITTKKGSLEHRNFGRYYINVMYTVVASGALMALTVICFPLEVKHQLVVKHTDLEQLALNLRIFSGFLLYLSLLTFVNVQHGLLVLQHKTEHNKMRQWPHLISIGFLLIGGIILIIVGMSRSHILYTVFGALGVALAFQMGHFCLVRIVSAHRWLVEHLSAYITSGIATYTAFLAFGGRSVFAGLGQWQLIFWVAPGVIGGIAITRMSWKYKNGLTQRYKIN